MSDDLPAAGGGGRQTLQAGQVAVERYKATYHIGPLPAPEDLAAYGDINPDLVLRIVDAADDERHHRHRMDAARVRRSAMGLVAGLVTAILFLAGSVWLVIEGHGVEGTVLGTIDLVALVALFVIGRKDNSP